MTFCYDGSYDNIFENVYFQIDTNWKLGFIGRNGRGKTTFLNLLLGKYEYKGKISFNINFDYFPYIVDDKSMQTIDILNSINNNYQLWELELELNKLNISEDVLYRPFYTLSNGEQTKSLLAILFLKENSFLLIDEPTTHLDVEARELVADYLNKKSGFILISHDRYFLDKCVDHIISINKTNIDMEKGNFSSWYENKKLRDNWEFEENQKLKSDIKRLTAASKRTEKWSDDVEKTKIGSGPCDRGAIGHKAAKMMKRSKCLEKRQNTAIEEKSKLLKNIETTDKLKLSPLLYHSNKLININNISLFFDNKIICKDINFVINSGDRICINGKNGSGKSSLLKLILGEQISYDGNLIIGSNLKISYISQDTSYLKGNLDDFAEEYNIDQTLFKTILRKLDFERIQFEKDISSYSGGQKKKILIAKSLCEKAHLYIWDEPLNFIDIFSRIQIENLILDFKPTLLFVEHDKLFCENIATKIVKI